MIDRRMFLKVAGLIASAPVIHIGMLGAPPAGAVMGNTLTLKHTFVEGQIWAHMRTGELMTVTSVSGDSAVIKRGFK